MDKEKRVEEMAKILCTDYDMGKCMVDGFDCLEGHCSKRERIESLYDAGYRKSADVAREIFEEIEEARERWEAVYSNDHFGYGGGACGYLEIDVDHTIYELKKKYTEESYNDDR